MRVRVLCTCMYVLRYHFFLKWTRHPSRWSDPRGELCRSKGGKEYRAMLYRYICTAGLKSVFFRCLIRHAWWQAAQSLLGFPSLDHCVQVRVSYVSYGSWSWSCGCNSSDLESRQICRPFSFTLFSAHRCRDSGLDELFCGFLFPGFGLHNQPGLEIHGKCTIFSSTFQSPHNVSMPCYSETRDTFVSHDDSIMVLLLLLFIII